MKWTDLNLSSLQAFVDTIELGSLTKAAEKNHVSRPAVSQAIRRIEEVVGFELIEHTKNNLVLTMDGRRFFQRAKVSLELFGRTLTDPLKSSNRIAIGCSATLAECLVLPALKKLDGYQGDEIKISIGTTNKIRQKVLDGETNLGIVIDDGKSIDLETVSLRRGHFNLLSKSGGLSGPIITTESRDEVRRLRTLLRKTSSPERQHIEIESWSACRKAAELLDGTCLVPDLVKSETLKRVREPKFSATYEIKALFRDANLLSEAECVMLKVFQK